MMLRRHLSAALYSTGTSAAIVAGVLFYAVDALGGGHVSAGLVYVVVALLLVAFTLHCIAEKIDPDTDDGLDRRRWVRRHLAQLMAVGFLFMVTAAVLR